MPTRSYSVLESQEPNAILLEWTGLLQGDDGEPFVIPYGACYIWGEVSGTFGSGGTIRFEGSLNGTTWGVMVMENNNAATFTAAASVALRGTPRLIRPFVSAGTGQNLSARVFLAGLKLPG
jgi:hypothetical protein